MSLGPYSGETRKLPRVFIGSSSSPTGLEVAKQLQHVLRDICIVELWKNGVFQLSMGTLEQLVDKASEYDFAILVLSPDDGRISGKDDGRIGDKIEHKVPRDNVVFEAGLFFGALGRERTFAFTVAGAELPTDLRGTNVVTLDLGGGREIVHAVSSNTVGIEAAIRDLGIRTVRHGNTSFKRLLEELQIGVRTRYAGPFPHCFEETCKMLQSAERSVRVLCDFPLYGYFSHYEQFNSYEKILETLSNDGVNLQFVFPTAEIRHDLLRIQVGDDWNKLQNDPHFRRSLEDFMKRRRISRIDSIESLLKHFDEIQARPFLHESGYLRDVEETESIPALYTWIVDDQRAIFTIPNFGKNSYEQGFYSSEPDVVEVLISVWKHYHPTLGPQIKRGDGVHQPKTDSGSSLPSVRKDSSEL